MSSKYKVNTTDGKTKTFQDIYDDLSEIIYKNKNLKKSVKESNMEVIENLFNGISDFGFVQPTVIQSETIVPFFKGQDIIAQSQSGTGKTGAFTIGCLSRIEPKNCYPQVIVISNTKDLADQTYQVFSNVSKHMGIKICLTIGGEYMTVRENVKQAKNSHVLICTPGRLDNIIKEKAFNTRDVKILVMDEADALLDNDFVDVIKSIAKSLLKQNEDMQTCIFSATFNEEVLKLTEKFLRENPFKVIVKREDLSLDIIKQYVVNLGEEAHKLLTLKDLYCKLVISQSIIFVRTIKKANIIYNEMKNDGHSIGILHGSLTSKERMEIMKDFRRAKTRILISTNVLSRGIDVQNIGVIFNYDIPDDVNTYLHRIGRSGRYGTKGVAINFVIASSNDNTRYKDRNRENTFVSDEDKIKEIQNHYNINIEELPNPDEINEMLKGVGDPVSSLIEQ
jgi:superfamily II DNA/RNA helicase